MMISTKAFLEVTVILSLVMVGAALFFALYRLLRGPTLPDRVVALDLIGTISVGVIGAYDIAVEQPLLLDAATVVALVAFMGTIGFASYVVRRGRDE
jgi:multicomponent Na+:H+ antiporter subunit F